MRREERDSVGSDSRQSRISFDSSSERFRAFLEVETRAARACKPLFHLDLSRLSNLSSEERLESLGLFSGESLEKIGEMNDAVGSELRLLPAATPTFFHLKRPQTDLAMFVYATFAHSPQ